MPTIVGWKPGDPIPDDLPEVELTLEEEAEIQAAGERLAALVDHSLDVPGKDDDLEDLPEYNPGADVEAVGVNKVGAKKD